MTKDTTPEAGLDETRAKLLRSKLGDLIAWKIPTLSETIGPSDPSIFNQFNERRLRLVNSCIVQLSQFTDDDISHILSRPSNPEGPAKHWGSFLDDELYRLRKQLPPWYAGGFGHSDHIPDFVHWARQAFHSVEELTCLSIGFDPREEIGKKIASISSKDPDIQYSSVKFLIERHELLSRQFIPKGYRRDVRPPDFLRWVDQIELEVHPEFLEPLRRFWQKDDKRVAATALPKPDKREIDTIAQLFTAMAIDQLGYNPRSARSSVPREIAELVSEMGMSISDDTIRKFLKLGASFIPDDWEPHSD